MRDGIYFLGDGTHVDVAYLTEDQIVAYGGFPQACKALGVEKIAHPECFYAMTCGIYPFFDTCGHA